VTLRGVKRGTAKKPAGPTMFCYHMGPATAAHLGFCKAGATECSAHDARDTHRPTWSDAYVIAIRYSKLSMSGMHAMLADKTVGASFTIPLLDHKREVCHA